jgi:hypothetical protein
VKDTPSPVEDIASDQELGASYIDHIYDEDFSPPSTPGTSDAEYMSDLPIDPELLTLVPLSFRRPPTLPGSDFTWRCDVRGCTYMIDLQHLTDENTDGLGQNVIVGLRSKDWDSVLEERVQHAFYFMVDRHWKRHLVQWDIKFVNPVCLVSFHLTRHQGLFRMNVRQCTLAWIHPKRHRPWPPVRENEPAARVPDVMEVDLPEDTA